MKSQKHHIMAFQNGSCIGYVGGCRYSSGTFRLVKAKSQAKGYVSESALHSDLDFLATVGMARGVSFCYD